MANAEQYRNQLIALQPPGTALPDDINSHWASLLLALSSALSRIESTAAMLRTELDPRTTTIFLDEWEKTLGLPDNCFPAAQTTTERRANIVAKLRARGGQSIAYLESVANNAGYPVFITNTGTHEFTVNSREPVNITELTCLSSCTDPLRTWGNNTLECVINNYKPAHTRALFAYGS